MNLYKTFLSAALLTSISFGAHAQNFIYEWGNAFGGTQTDIGKDVTTDPSGNVILLSEFRLSYDADPGAGTTTLSSQGGTDISIAKFDTDGNLLWAKSIGGSADDIATRVATDSDGNIYISGAFRNSVDFDPGIGENIAISNGGADIFLLKLDENGDFLWVYTNGSVQDEVARDVVINDANDVYITGYFRNTIQFDPIGGTANLISQGGADVFVLKLNPFGEFVSVYQAGGINDDDANAIGVDNYGNVYVSGYFQGTCNFNVSGFPQNITSNGGNDAFVMKLNASNAFQWVRRVGGLGNEISLCLTIDNKDNVIMGGYFSGTVDFNPGAAIDEKTSNGGIDLMMVKLAPNGNYIMGVAAGGIGDDFMEDITVDNENNIFSTGVMRNTVDFDPGSGTQNVTVTGGTGFADQFFWKLTENGEYLFATHLGGTDNDHGYAVHIDGQFLYTSGYFNGSADFDFSSGTQNVISNLTPDISFQKHVNCNPINTTDVIVSCSPITWADGNTYNADNNTAFVLLTNQFGCDSLVTLDFRLVAIDDQTLTASDSEFCDEGAPSIELGSTQTGVFYSLINQSTGTVLDGPIEGTGAALSLNGGNITSTTTFEVEAITNKNNKLAFTGNSATPTRVSIGNEMNSVFAGKDQITVEAWINTNSTASLQTVLSNYNSFGNSMQFLLRLDHVSGLNKASFWMGTGPNSGNYQNVAGTTTILPNTWYHIAGTYDGNEMAIYVNGVLENTFTINSKMPYITNDVRIGGGLDNNSEYFNGNITGVRIWNMARTGSDINADKDQCIAGNTNGLVAMYNMIDGAGSSVLSDEGVNGFNGTLINMNENTAWSYTNLPAIACQTCTSIMTTTPTVTVNESNTGTDVQEHCETYTWIDGNTYTASNNTATFSLVNAAGCDSLVTLNLTINNSNSGTDVITACDSYTWIDGNTYTASNNAATFTLLNQNNCDSIVTLNLTIVASPTAGAVDNGNATISATGMGTYQWIDCATNTAISGATSALFAPTQNGSYQVVVSNGNCSDTSDCVTISTVGLFENEMNSLSVYPNPTSGSVTLSINSGIIANISVKDAAGRVVLNKQIQATTTALDLSGMQNGVYFVEVLTENNAKQTIRVVKQ
jgi:hypothetical protein